MTDRIEVGQMIFLVDGELGVGAVREVLPGSSELVINIQNGGDFTIPVSAVRDVHSGKVLLDADALPEPVREALRHPHDNEFNGSTYAAADPQDGALKD